MDFFYFYDTAKETLYPMVLIHDIHDFLCLKGKL